LNVRRLKNDWPIIYGQNLNIFGFAGNYIIDRNLSVGMTMVDECHGQMPSQFPDNIGREGEKAMYSEKSLAS
jgi:hypothetical protein